MARQRYAYLNPDRSSARVTPERKALLDKLGMVWEKYDPWQERYDLALAYKTEHGDLEIPSVYKTADGVWLGSWVSRQRQALNSGNSALSSERRKLLRILFKGERRPSDPAADHGTVREANWERNFRSAARYARKYKHLLVPASYVDSDGVRLGVWISNPQEPPGFLSGHARPHQKAEQHRHGVGCPGCQVGNCLSAGKGLLQGPRQPPRRRQLQIR